MILLKKSDAAGNGTAFQREIFLLSGKNKKSFPARICFCTTCEIAPSGIIANPGCFIHRAVDKSDRAGCRIRQSSDCKIHRCFLIRLSIDPLGTLSEDRIHKKKKP